MNIYPGDEVWYRFASNKTHMLVEEAVGKDLIWSLSGRRITAQGEIHKIDIPEPFEETLHEATIVKHVTGVFKQTDPGTGMVITHDRDEEAFVVWYGDGVVAMVETLEDAWDLIARYAA